MEPFTIKSSYLAFILALTTLFRKRTVHTKKNLLNMHSPILVNICIAFLNFYPIYEKKNYFQIFLFAIVSSTIAVPIIPELIERNEDVISQQTQPNPAQLIRYFLRLLLTDDAPTQTPQFNPANLVSIAGRLLGRLNEGPSRDESVQDPRVLNYEQEINRRNQLSRIVGVFANLLS